MATVVRETIGTLNDKITVKLDKADYLPSFEKKLKEYSKTANIPGFRKGMVPAGMIKKMYGPSIFSDEILKTVEKELYTYLNTEKPDIFAQPLPVATEQNRIDMNNPGEYEFGFEMGLKPEFTIADLAKGKFTKHVVAVTDQMIDEEISRMQIKGGQMTEPETIDNPENVLNVLFTEVNENGDAVEGGIVKENSVLLKYFTPAMQEQLTGKHKGDHFIFQLNKTFEGDKLEMMLQDLGFEKNDQEAAGKFFKLEIVKIGLVEKRGMDETFFNEVFPGKNIATEEDFRNSLKAEIEQYWNSQANNQLHDQLYHYLLDETNMEFPETFLKRWLQTGGEKEKTAEEAEAEFPGFSNQLKWTLISDRITRENNLEVTEEELRAHMREEVMRYFGQMNMEDMSWMDSYLDRMMKDEKQTEATYRRLVTEKLFNWMGSQVSTTEKKVTAEELTGMMHNHQH